MKKRIKLNIEGRTRTVLIIGERDNGMTQVAYRYYMDGGLRHTLVPTNTLEAN